MLKEAGGRIPIVAGLLIVAIVVVFPFLTTHYVTQDDSQVALLGWRDVARSLFESARISGRFYYIFSSWFGWIPYAVDDFAYFKTLQLVALLGNFAALYFLASKVGRSTSFALLALLIALVTTQSRWEHNLVAAYPWAFSTSLTLAMAAVGLFVEYLDGARKWKQLLSAALFFLSLLTYESFLLYALIFALLARPRRQGVGHGLAVTLRAIWPHAALASLYLAAYVGFRVAFPTLYGGTRIRFAPSAVVAVWKTFGRSALPGSAFVDLTGLVNEFSDSYTGYAGGALAALRQIRVEWVILAIVVVLLCVSLLPRAASDSQGIRLGRAAVVALVMAVVPQIPHALSPQYQDWVRLGTKSHIPTYFIGFGIALLLACAATAVARLFRGAWPWTWCVSAALAYVALLTAFSNFYVARSQTIARRKWELADALLRSEQFKKLPDNALVLAPTWWQGVNIMQVLDDYWTRYAHKKTGRSIQFLRTFAAFQDACRNACNGRAYFAKYAREGQEANQYMILAPLEGDPAKGLSARSLDVFVLSRNHWLSIFAGLPSDTASTVTVDGVAVTESARGSVWVRLDRREEHRAPFTFRVSSHPGLLDPDSVVLSDYGEGDQFAGTVQAIFGEGFYSEEKSGNAIWNWAEERATLILRNPSSLPREVTISFLVSGTAPSCHIALEQDGTKRSISGGSLLEQRVEARVGSWQESRIHFESDCARAPGDPRNLRFNLRSLHISERPAPGRQP